MSLHRNLTAYLMAHGWEPAQDPGPGGQLWEHAMNHSSIAIPNTITEGSLDWRSVISRLVEVEYSSIERIEMAIMLQSVDVANLRAANDIVISDTIPYQAALTMMQSSWAMLRSCATTSMKVRPQIRGAYSREGNRIVDNARMAHTQRGSFIIPLLMPVSEPIPVDEGLVEAAPPEPVERRIMRTFAEALTKIDSVAVQPERSARADDIMELVFAGVSAEFANALHRVLSEDAVAEFGASFVWAPLGGLAPEGLQCVSVPAAAATRVKEVAERLQVFKPKRDVEVLVGPVVGIVRNRDGIPGGVVTVDTWRNNRNVHVKVRITNDELLDTALDWMKKRSTVAIEGRVGQKGTPGLFLDRDDGIEPLASKQLTSELP